MISFK
jgi:hypothetical protein